MMFAFFFFSSRRRHTRSLRDWSSDVCSSDLRRACWPRSPILCRRGDRMTSPTFTIQTGRTLAGTLWEIYGDWSDDPSKVETTVCYLLARRRRSDDSASVAARRIEAVLERPPRKKAIDVLGEERR